MGIFIQKKKTFTMLVSLSMRYDINQYIIYTLKKYGGSMKELLKKIKALLSKHVEMETTFNPPATEEQILSVEENLGFKLSNDVRELYRVHNGQNNNGTLFFGLKFLSLDESFEIWKDIFCDDVLSSIYDVDIISIPPKSIKEVKYSKRYFPIATDFGGNFLVIDYDPDLTNGHVGQVINAGREEDIRYVITKNIRDFFEYMIDAVESNNFRLEDPERCSYWYIGNPQNSHFFDALKKLDLPYKYSIKSTQVDSDNSQSFEEWKIALSPNWQNVLQKECRETTSWKDIKRVNSLRLLNYKFEDITPLEKFVGLRELILSGNPVSDISSISHLKQLKKLYLAKTNIESLEAIKELPLLAHLSLFNTKINSFENLLSIKSLTDLCIEKTLITELEGIEKLQNLRTLNLNGMKFHSFKPIGQLQDLRKINLEKTNINSIYALGDLNNLSKLLEININHTPINSVKGIENFKNLFRIEIYDTKVSDFTPIAHLENLNSVWCGFKEFMQIKDLFDHKLDFVLVGEKTDEQIEIWSNYFKEQK